MISSRYSSLSRIFVFILIGLFWPIYTWAQSSLLTPNSLSDYYVDTWTSTEGLPHNSINAIAQTQDGYLWFATWEGVARYNGLEFRLFDRNPDTHMLDSGTRALVSAEDNSLWVGGARGSLSLRTGFTWHQQPVAPSMVNHVLIDQFGNQWLAIEGQGVVRRQLNSDGSYSENVWVLENTSAYRLVQNTSNKIFAATEKGLFRLSDSSAERIETSSFEKVYYLSLAQNGELFLGTNRGAWRFDGNELTLIEPSMDKTVVTVVEQDTDGNIWFGTINKGLARLSDGVLEFLDASRGLPNNRVLSWYQDIEGSIWVGTNGGLIRLRNAPFMSITQDKGLVGNYVRTLLPIEDDVFLAGSSNGLSLIKQDTAQPAIKSDVSLSVLSLANASDGGVWVGTYQQGLMHWNSGIVEPIVTDKQGLPTNEVRAILEDTQHNLWIGTPFGLVKKQPDGALLHFTQQNGLSDDYVMALAEDELGHIWIGTGVGVGFWDGDKFINIDLDKLEQSQYAFGFYLEKGYVWIATDRGIVRYRQSDQSIALVGRPQGLPIDKFFQIQKDNDGYFWLSSNRGIWKIDANRAHQVADKEESNIIFEHFDETDGMASSQANGGSNPASAKLSNGAIYFATAKGVAAIHPNNLYKLSRNPLPVVLQSVRFDSDAINPDLQHFVPAGTSRVSISYVGLGYVMSQRIQYRTKLEGFDYDWSERRSSRTAEFTNLHPGHYKFLVSARYPYGSWTEAKILYEFDVEPLFWQRKDVIVFIILSIVALIGSGVFWRIQMLKRSAMYLKQQVELQTQELRSQAEMFEKLSHEDELTGVANRRAFDLQLKQRFGMAKQSGEVLHVAVLDIDHFKLINDKYSHLVGDHAIVEVVNVLRSYIDSDTLLARWGGEEFTLLFNHSESDIYLERLRAAIEAHNFDNVALQLRITVSIGVSSSEFIEDYEDLLKLADHALLNAKRNGRNRVERISL
ncbi:ligand-binding sensor domain-containing protein [Vibrio ziniensis]|uniref:diguanylate cyclase n=1 Tax=Vibrio ziniensis TaxID=2711221 RepID=A0A6G7CI25_9VIBR|nr:ligand-binding sensor domain-containing diguanylate cyclase [Vibrio ziniensis]QIH41696.1 diguanylate cyclase [Vibrio ziniensis]